MKRVEAVEKKYWDELFDSKDELIMISMNLNYHREELVPKGYVVLESIQEQYRNGRSLSDKQISDIKNLAKHIYVYANRMGVKKYMCRRS